MMRLRRSLRRLIGNEAGASAVEFALVIGPFLLIVLGLFEFGRMYWTQNALQQAAISGARCIGIRQSECSTGGLADLSRANAYVQGIARGWMVPIVGADISLSDHVQCSGVPGFAQVSIAYEFRTPLPRFIMALADGTTLSASSCFPNGAA